MSNDMKLIMEAWRETLNEYDPYGLSLLHADPESMRIKPGALADLLDAFEALEKSDDYWWIALLIDMIDPIGITDWRDAVYSWHEYMEWYMKDDEYKEKNASDGAQLFVAAVINIILAFPFVDLIPGIAAAKGSGKFLSKPVLKYIVKKLFKYLGVASGVGALHYAATGGSDLAEYNDLINRAKEDLEAKQELIDKYDNERPDSNAVKRWKERIKSHEALAKMAKIADPSVLQQPRGGARTQN